MQKVKNIPLPGLRIIKTGIAVMFCMMCYRFIDREGVMLAAVAAIICMQDSVEKSITLGANRVRGTIFGGLLATIFVLLGAPHAPFVVLLLCTFGGLVFYMYICNLMDIKQSITIGCLVFLMILLDAEKAAEPLSYCLNRTLDTLIGIVFAVSVNRFMFRPAPERTAGERRPAPMVEYGVHRANHFKNTAWSGGVTTELYIYPEDSIYADRNFDFRVSTAAIELEDSNFTKLPGYKRYIMLLEGEMRLYHEGFHNIDLALYEQDCFKGDWTTKSHGRCRDLNLMAKEGYSGGLEAMKAGSVYNVDPSPRCYTGVYVTADRTRLHIIRQEKEVIEQLGKGDYVSFICTEESAAPCTIWFSIDETAQGEVAGVKICCHQDHSPLQ